MSNINLITLEDMNRGFRKERPVVFLKINKDSKERIEQDPDRFFDELNTMFTESMWLDCESQIDDTIAVHSDHRRSKHLKLYSEFWCKEFITFLNENNLVPSPNGWSILRYLKGDLFRPHTDRIGEYTAILYPKSFFNDKIKGGKIIIGDFELLPSEIENHTLLIFKTDLVHEVTEILEGTRYVMKIPLFKAETFSIMDSISENKESQDLNALMKSEDKKRHYEIRNSDELWNEYVRLYGTGRFGRSLKYGQMD